jgi:hypothetical protein
MCAEKEDAFSEWNISQNMSLMTWLRPSPSPCQKWLIHTITSGLFLLSWGKHNPKVIVRVSPLINRLLMLVVSASRAVARNW